MIWEMFEVFWFIIVEFWYIWLLVLVLTLVPYGFNKLEEWVEKRRLKKYKDLNEWKKLSGREFEKMAAIIFEEQGYKAKVVGGAGDKGIDIKLKKDGRKYFVQCKNMERVQPKDVRAFWGSIEEYIRKEKIKKGYFVTTGDFSKAGKEFVKNKPIELFNGLKLENFYK